jgi:hypothetical protein
MALPSPAEAPVTTTVRGSLGESDPVGLGMLGLLLAVLI